MKNKNIGLALLFALSLTSCDKGYFDNLGGGGSASDTSESQTIDLPDEETEITTSEVNQEGAIKIDLGNLQSSTDYYKYKNDVLAISAAGTYELSGKLEGSIEVAKKAINLILAGVDIQPKETQYVGAIVYKKENTSNVVLNIKENTVNTLSDSKNDIESYNADADEGVLVVKGDTTLSIEGKGTLNIKTNGSDSNGIKVKNTNLTIVDTTINIEANKNGIKSGKGLLIKNATIDVNAGNDGIKTDMVADNETDAKAYASDIYSGYVYIENSDINVVSKDDGIVADSYMHIKNGSNKITVKTNGGAPSNITERSSDAADGKAIKVGGISMEVNDVETEYKSTSEFGYYLVIESGNFEINSNCDSLSSKGNMLLSGGTYNINAGDDAIHSEYLTKITGGDITINKCYEGIEGAQVEIYGGNINITAADDGINAANGDLKNYDYNLYIGGGTIIVNAQGDGVDSNGSLEFAGGTTFIYGPTGNDNAALDADDGILMNGGTLVAVGSSGMAEIPGSNSKQCVVGWNFTTSNSSNTAITFKVNGDEVISVTAPKSFASVIVSSPGLKSGDSIVLTVGKQSKSTTISTTITTYGNFNAGQPGGNNFGPGGNGGPGGFGGGGQGGGMFGPNRW